MVKYILIIILALVYIVVVILAVLSQIKTHSKLYEIAMKLNYKSEIDPNVYLIIQQFLERMWSLRGNFETLLDKLDSIKYNYKVKGVIEYIELYDKYTKSRDDFEVLLEFSRFLIGDSLYNCAKFENEVSQIITISLHEIKDLLQKSLYSPFDGEHRDIVSGAFVSFPFETVASLHRSTIISFENMCRKRFNKKVRIKYFFETKFSYYTIMKLIRNLVR